MSEQERVDRREPGTATEPQQKALQTHGVNAAPFSKDTASSILDDLGHGKAAATDRQKEALQTYGIPAEKVDTLNKESASNVLQGLGHGFDHATDRQKEALSQHGLDSGIIDRLSSETAHKALADFSLGVDQKREDALAKAAEKMEQREAPQAEKDMGRERERD